MLPSHSDVQRKIPPEMEELKDPNQDDVGNAWSKSLDIKDIE